MTSESSLLGVATIYLPAEKETSFKTIKKFGPEHQNLSNAILSAGVDMYLLAEENGLDFKGVLFVGNCDFYLNDSFRCICRVGIDDITISYMGDGDSDLVVGAFNRMFVNGTMPVESSLAGRKNSKIAEIMYPKGKFEQTTIGRHMLGQNGEVFNLMVNDKRKGADLPLDGGKNNVHINFDATSQCYKCAFRYPLPQSHCGHLF